MNGSAKRMMAMIAVLAMIASAMVVVFTDEQDSSADISTSTYYGDQLETDLAKNSYIAFSSMDDFTDTMEITYTLSDLDKIAEMGSELAYLNLEISKGFDAIRFDDPRVVYYYNGYTMSYNGSKVTITPNIFDTTRFTGDKSVFDTNINTWIAATSITGSGFEKIRNVHDYVSGHLNYDDDGALNTASDARKGNTRSVYNALDPSYDLKEGGKNLVVCEGYAKMFKVLCDYYDIPCIIATGTSYDGTDSGNHMWNYVYYNDRWFLVDCTWDWNEGGSPYTNYLLAGTNKVVNSIKVEDSHDPCGITEDYNFSLTFDMPGLSALSIDVGTGDIEPGLQHAVTFKVGTDIYKISYAVDGTPVSYPADPSVPGQNFLGWIKEGETEHYSFSEAVTEDFVLIADMTSDPVYKLIYDCLGGTKVPDTIVLVTENTTKITNLVPTREGYKFIEWNTAKDGTGLTFKEDQEITLVSDYTLYAIWEDTNSVTYKIDSTVDRINEFLGQETISGVSNMVLTIGVITGIISLLAIAAIARK